MDKKKNTLTEGDVLKALYHMYCAAEYKGSVTMSSETAIGLYNFFHAQKEEINQLKETLSATIAGQETLQKYLVEQKAIQAEAIKEFAERLNKEVDRKLNEEWNFEPQAISLLYSIKNFIEKSKKEMVSEE
ncbi:MAG: hypothetical protein IKM48_08635 [Clostridia bacterium]|nr:hypothetical protein [Clostridia bacterium]